MLKLDLLLLALAWLVMHTAQGATNPSKITRFRPITQSEYDAILSLTDGKPVVSEGRLIASGLAALVGLTTGWMTSLRLSNILASVGLTQKSNDDSYPLCVIKNEGTASSGEQHEHHSHQQHPHYLDESYEHYPNSYEPQHEGGSYEHDSSGEHYDYHDYDHEHFVSEHKNKLSPVVNCIVVVKKDKHTNEHEHYQSTTSRKRPQHYSPYPYPVSGMQPPPPGSYNNPWYWQTPYYNPYYSNTRFYTNPNPFAYANIYGTANPSAYPFNYPGAITNPFTATFTNNNPRFGKDPLTSGVHPDAASSTNAIDTYITETSSATSDYSGIENVAASEFSSPNAEEGESYAMPHIDASSAPRKFKNFPSSKIPLKLIQTTRSTSTSKPHQHNKQVLASSSSSPSTKVHNTTKRTKTKRDESVLQSNSYAKLATHSHSGYQPKLYPRSGYPSTYPKISYMQPLPYLAPIYVRNSHQQEPVGILKMRRYQESAESEADSEENEDENDFIQARFYSRQNY